MASAVEVIFWISAFVALYVYVGYPVLLAMLARVGGWEIRRREITPFVSLLVAAYNEADVIAAKVRNGLQLDYPADRLEIAIVSDGSTDDTAALARHAAGGAEQVRVFEYQQNRGKIQALNDTVPQLRGEILALSDASSMLARDALCKLVTHFGDPRVGAVSGVYKVRKKEEAELGVQESFYWKYETFIKLQEARLGSILGGHGSLYAIRKELYPFPAPGTINDDYVIPLRILQKGYRVSYEPAAVAYEEAHEMGGFGRRVRIMSGNLQQLRELGGLLRPVRPMPLFFFLSHKVGRLLVPLAMGLLLVSNAMLLANPVYRASGLMQLAFYLLAAAGALTTLSPKVLRLPYYFCMINVAIFWALFRSMAPGRRTWK